MKAKLSVFQTSVKFPLELFRFQKYFQYLPTSNTKTSITPFVTLYVPALKTP